MKFSKSFIIKAIGTLLMLSFSSGFVFANQHLAPIKGFQDWKNEKVQTVVAQANYVRAQITRAQIEGNLRLQESLERQLQQLKWNGEVARDLTVADYFSLYLTQQPHGDRFQQAAKRMSPQEVAELMESYSNVLDLKKPESQIIRGSLVESQKSPLNPSQAAQQK
jgi:hypothetical protein